MCHHLDQPSPSRFLGPCSGEPSTDVDGQRAGGEKRRIVCGDAEVPGS
jgi:hypothetical protein